MKEMFCMGDGKGNCIAKEEAPFDTFVCDNGEQFEKYYSDDIEA